MFERPATTRRGNGDGPRQKSRATVWVSPPVMAESGNITRKNLKTRPYPHGKSRMAFTAVRGRAERVGLLNAVGSREADGKIVASLAGHVRLIPAVRLK